MKISLLLAVIALFAQAQLAHAGGSIARCTSESGKAYFVTNPDNLEDAFAGSTLGVSFLTDVEKHDFVDADIKIVSHKLMKDDSEDDQDHYKYYSLHVELAKKTGNDAADAALAHGRFNCELEWWHK
ncbi:MAG: hypothetical protein ACXVBE_04460 [Bdellovibrionota bacterium]